MICNVITFIVYEFILLSNLYPLPSVTLTEVALYGETFYCIISPLHAIHRNAY